MAFSSVNEKMIPIENKPIIIEYSESKQNLHTLNELPDVFGDSELSIQDGNQIIKIQSITDNSIDSFSFPKEQEYMRFTNLEQEVNLDLSEPYQKENINPKIEKNLLTTSEEKIPVIVKLKEYTAEKTTRSLVYNSIKKQTLNRISKTKTRDLKSINSFSTELSKEEIKELADSKYVERIYSDYELKIQLYDSTRYMDIENVWWLNDSEGNQILGYNTTVVVIDSGIDYHHEDFGNCSTINSGGDCKVIGGYDFINEDEDPIDDNGHGTHVAGIVAANPIAFEYVSSTGTVYNRYYSGVAPDAKIIAYKVTDEEGVTYASLIIEAIERALDPNQDGNNNDHYDIATISIGAEGGSPDDPLSQAIDNAVDNGMIVTVSAGNSGPYYESINCPACSRKAIAVGATNKWLSVSSYSSRGPYNDIFKPEVLAFGGDVPAAGGGICASRINDNIVEFESTGLCVHEDGDHTRSMGTSMAAPHIAGIAALLLQEYPEMDPDEFRSRIMTTADSRGNNPYIQGAGQADGLEAYEAELIVSTPGIAFGYTNISEDYLIKYINITNIVNYTLNLDLDTDPLKNEELESFNVVFVNQTLLTLGPGETKTVRLFIDVTNDNIEGYTYSEIEIDSQNGNHYQIPITAMVTYSIKVNVRGLNGEPLFPNLFYTHDGSYRNVQLFDIETSIFNDSYTFNRPRGTYYFYAIGDRDDRELDYILMKKVNFSDFSAREINLSLQDAIPYTLKAESNDGTPLRIFSFFKHIVTRTYYDPVISGSWNRTYASSVTELLYGFKGNRTIYISENSDWNLETDIIFKVEGVPIAEEYEIDWSGDELLNDYERRKYSEFYDNYKTSSEVYAYGFVLPNRTWPTTVLSYEPDEYTDYTYHVRFPGESPETMYNQMIMVFPLSHNYYPSLLYPIYPFSAPMDRVYHLAGTPVGRGYYHDWEFHNKVNINYISPDDTNIPEINDDFHNTVHQEEIFGETRYYDKFDRLIKDFRTFEINPTHDQEVWIGKAPYKLTTVYSAPYMTYTSSASFERIDLTNTPYFVKGYSGNSYMTKFTEYAYMSLLTGAIQNFSFSKPNLYYTRPIYAPLSEDLVDDSTGGHGRWYTNFLKTPWQNGIFHAELTIPLLTDLYNYTKITSDVIFEQIPQLPTINYFVANEFYNLGDNFDVSFKLSDADGYIASANVYYLNDGSWTSLSHTHSGITYYVTVENIQVDELVLKVEAIDGTGQRQEMIINPLAKVQEQVVIPRIHNFRYNTKYMQGENFSVKVVMDNNDYINSINMYYLVDDSWIEMPNNNLVVNEYIGTIEDINIEEVDFKIEVIDISGQSLEINVDNLAQKRLHEDKIPTINNFEHEEKYNFGDDFELSMNITDDISVEEVNMTYWTGTDWANIPYTSIGTVYTGTISNILVEEVNFKVNVWDNFNQHQEIEINPLAKRTQNINITILTQPAEITAGDEIYVQGIVTDENSEVGYIKLDFYNGDEYLRSYPTNDSGHFEFWHVIPQDYQGTFDLRIVQEPVGVYDFNEIIVPLNIEGLELPDLVVSSITTTPEIYDGEGSLNITYTLNNTGNSDVVNNFFLTQVSLLNETLEYEYHVASYYDFNLSIGEEKEYTYTIPITEDDIYGNNIYLLVSTDSDDDILEWNETNNHKILTVDVVGYPDLAIEDFVWGPQNPILDDEIYFTMVVRNIGDGATNATSFSFTYLDGGMVGGGGGGGPMILEPGNSYNITHTYTASYPGNVTIIFSVGSTPEDSDMSNNEVNASFYVTELNCTIPTDGMSITENTTFCLGTYDLPNGVEIAADDIVLDCNDSVLNGSNSNSGIYSDNENITIINCIITNYNHGIDLTYATNNFVNNNYLESNYVGIYLLHAENNVIFNDKVTETDNIGIYLGLSENNEILENNVSNSVIGIYLSSSSNNNHVSSNYISLSSDIAVNIYQSNNNIINLNDVYSNDKGIFITSSFNNTASSNNVEFSGVEAIRVSYSGNTTVIQNNVSNNFIGIRLYISNNNSIIKNQIFENTHFGIVNDHSDNNEIISNTIYANEENGVYLLYSNNNLISFNNIYTNQNGIMASVSFFDTIEYNNIYDNVAYNTILYLGQTENFTSENNYWGTTNETEIKAKIYDYYDDNTMGIVDYCPFLDAAYPGGESMLCNVPPVLNLINDITTNETNTITIIANATDENNNILIYSINDFRFSQDNNVFTWTPTNEDVGVYDVIITVSDSYSNDSEEFTITINSINDLSVGNLYVVNSSPNAGENVQIRFFIYNNGQNSQDVSYMIDTDSADQNLEYTTSNVGPGSFRITWVSWAYTAAGSYNPTIIIDNNHELNEFDETNNELEFDINPVNANQIVLPPVIVEPIDEDEITIIKKLNPVNAKIIKLDPIKSASIINTKKDVNIIKKSTNNKINFGRIIR